MVDEKPVVPLVCVPSSDEKSVLLSSENRSPEPDEEDEEDSPVDDETPEVPLVLDVALVMELSESAVVVL